MAQGWKEAFDSIRDCPYWGATMAKNRRVLFIFDDQFDELEKGAKI